MPPVIHWYHTNGLPMRITVSLITWKADAPSSICLLQFFLLQVLGELFCQDIQSGVSIILRLHVSRRCYQAFLRNV